jgi:hypothetical protein
MGLLIGLFRIDMVAVELAFRAAPRRGAGIFLIAVSTLFTLMWLGMIVPAIPGDLPAGRIVYDIASPVHLLDRAGGERSRSRAARGAGLSNRPPTLGLVEWMADTAP